MFWNRKPKAECDACSTTYRRIAEGVYLILQDLRKIREELRAMATTIVTRDQFDQALKAGLATITGKIDDLAAKVAAGQVTTPEDFSAELKQLQDAVSHAVTVDPDTPSASTGDGTETAAS